MTRLKSFGDIIAIWTTQGVGWVLGFALNDLIEIAVLIKEVFAIIAFGVGIWYTIHRLRKSRKEKNEKSKE